MSDINDNHKAVQHGDDTRNEEVTSAESPATIEKADSSKNALYAGSGKLPYAGFWMRFWAYLADLIVIGSINRILIHPIFKTMDIGSPFEWFTLEAILTSMVFYLYFVLMTKYTRQTLGKMIFGLKVMSLKEEKLTWGTVIFREFIGRFIAKFAFIGYIIAGFLPKKQGLHDIFADTAVLIDRR
ncbi:RDD family protein [Peribacillus sp. SCS-155]|uniref:RDD family protein n=1 Tax=Peribacillus sedimenti TaxID=3115297 RepID=UPI0039064F8A